MGRKRVGQGEVEGGGGYRDRSLDSFYVHIMQCNLQLPETNSLKISLHP